jgi:hypothetical protein
MALDERNIIALVRTGQDDTVTLSIADHLSWDELGSLLHTGRHARARQKKRS